MKKAIFTILMALLCINVLQAKHVDVQQAQKLALLFSEASTGMRSTGANLAYTATTDREIACFYVFAMQPKGFIIVSADDRAKPILAYSEESNFNPNFIPEGLMTFFDNYKAGIAHVIKENLEQSEKAKQDWHSLAETGKIIDSKITRSVLPLLHSIWNQTDLYNAMAPEDPESVFSGHCKSGCVANSMSQIMRYLQN
jgi:Peptidase C10 family.